MISVAATQESLGTRLCWLSHMLLLNLEIPLLEQECKQQVGGGKPDFKLKLLCVQAVTAKGCPKCIIIEKQERKKQLSDYKQC